MIKSCKPSAGAFLLVEKVCIRVRVGKISLSGEYFPINGQDILNIHLIGYSDSKNQRLNNYLNTTRLIYSSMH